ncbi:DUF1735 domain-containing protein [Bacteroides pyogenes]|uniref:DUF1735 domain-containing protein n=1 Tax=Bacteroides pyogenes TaxID=310300 RepID=UPI002FDA5444
MKAFIDNRCFYPKNSIETNIVQTSDGSKLIVNSESVKTRVQLTNAAPQDLTFSMKVDNSAIAETDGATLLTDDAVSFINQTVTVKKGEIESKDFIVFALNGDSKSLREFQDKGILGFSLNTSDDVEISKEYGTYLWKVNKEITNINVDGDLKDKTQVAFEDYDVLDPSYHTPIDDLDDPGYLMWSGYVRMYAQNPNIYLQINMKKDFDLAGFSIYPMELQGSWDYNPKKLEILGGPDEQNLTRIGFAVSKQKPSSKDPWEIVFYSPIQVKCLRILVTESYSDNDLVLIPGLKLFK